MLQTIKIGVLEVFPSDFPKTMNFREANVACARLGEGWRLPSSSELKLLEQYQDLIGGFKNIPHPNYYWTNKYNAENYTLIDDFHGLGYLLRSTYLLVRPVKNI